MITTTSPFTLLRPRAPTHRRLLPRTPVRLASQRGPRRPQYNRFGNAQTIYSVWKTSPNFRYGVGAVGLSIGGIYYYNLEQVPISGRRRFNCISPAREEAMAKSQYQGIMQAYGREILPPSHPDSKMVNKVLQRLIPAAGLEGQNWEVKVIDDPEQMNAFVLPGGKVFVFSGILPICAGEDGLAAVLGHEIAHNVAHHTGEKLSQMTYLIPLGLLLTFTFDIPGQFSQFLLDIAFEKPGSREMESEADYIGLLMMAKACYDPNAAVGLWYVHFGVNFFYLAANWGHMPSFGSGRMLYSPAMSFYSDETSHFGSERIFLFSKFVRFLGSLLQKGDADSKICVGSVWRRRMRSSIRHHNS